MSRRFFSFSEWCATEWPKYV